MKRWIAGMAAVCMAAILFFPVEVSAVSAEHAIVMDAATGRVLFERRADEQSLIASTTKIMTALVVCEQCNVLDRMRIPKEAGVAMGHVCVAMGCVCVCVCVHIAMGRVCVCMCV